jgi:hypothetical protein
VTKSTSTNKSQFLQSYSIVDQRGIIDEFVDKI